MSEAAKESRSSVVGPTYLGRVALLGVALSAMSVPFLVVPAPNSSLVMVGVVGVMFGVIGPLALVMAAVAERAPAGSRRGPTIVVGSAGLEIRFVGCDPIIIARDDIIEVIQWRRSRFDRGYSWLVVDTRSQGTLGVERDRKGRAAGMWHPSWQGVQWPHLRWALERHGIRFRLVISPDINQSLHERPTK